MAASRFATPALLSFLGFSTLACGSAGDPPEQAHFDDSGSDDPMVPCDPGTPEFTTGMTNGLKATDSTGQISVRIDTAPKPPEKNFNTWDISVLGSDGQPNANARLNWACAWMPVHGHGSNPQSISNLGDGRFELFKQNFAMSGPWEVRFWIDGMGGGPEYQPQTSAAVVGGNNCMPSNGAQPNENITFKICVPQSGAQM